MSSLIIQKFPYDPGTPESDEAENPYLTVIRQMVASLGRCISTSDAGSEVSRELSTIAQKLEARGDQATVTSIGGEIEELLRTFQTNLQKANEERAEEVQKLFAVLTETFTSFSITKERSRNRLQRLESSLRVAARTEDLRLLRNQLSQILNFVHQEAGEERDQTSEALHALRTQIAIAHPPSTRVEATMPGREQAITEMRSLLLKDGGGRAFAAVCTAETLVSLEQRHGTQVSETFLGELSREELKEFSGNGMVFRWSADSLLLIWRSSEILSEVNRRLADLFATPYHYRAFVGSRTATFTIPLRFLALQVTGDLDELVADLDHLSGLTVIQ